MSGNENLLGDFLRARRELVDPKELGLVDYGRRRVAGLRREELAAVAGVSAHYYTRLEQGRDRHPSPAVLGALGRVLQLDELAMDHLRRLAEPEPVRRKPPRRTERVPSEISLLLSRWHAEAAVIIGRHRDILAATEMARILNPAFTPGRNLLRHTFLDPAAHEIYPDWEEVAMGAVAGLRASAGTEVDDAQLTDLVGELSLKSEDFRRMWARHDVKERTRGSKRFVNPLVGPLTLQYATFAVTGTKGQTLFVFFAQPGSPDDDSLALLATIVASQASDEQPGATDVN